MKKNRITEIVIATILIISLASSYKYYISDKKVQTTSTSDESTSDSKDKLVELEKEDFIKMQVVEFNQPLTVYGSEANSNMKLHPTDNFQFAFSNFRIIDKLPKELLKERLLSFPNAYNEDGSLKRENTCIAKVDFKITNMNNEMAVTYRSGFRCYQVDDQYVDLKSGTNEGSVFFESNIGKDETTIDGPIKLHAAESYSDTVYFIIDKVTEEKCELVILVAPFGMNDWIVKNKLTYNNAFGYIKVNYTDIIKE